MLNVEIISVENIIFQGKCAMVTVPSVAGDAGIMQGHEAFIAELKEGKIILYNEGQEIIKEIDVVSGFAEIHDGERLVVLLDS